MVASIHNLLDKNKTNIKMKNIHYISFYAALLFCSCTSTSIPVETIGINGENVLVLNESKVKETVFP